MLFSIVFNILLFFSSCRSWHFLESRRAWSAGAVYAHTHTVWLLLSTIGSHSQLTAVLAGAVGSVTVCVCGGGGGEGVDYDKLQRNMANSGLMCMLGKKRKEIFLSGILPKCSALHSYSIKKEAYMKDLRKLYTLKKLNFKAPQNGQNWNLISGMCFTMDFLTGIATPSRVYLIDTGNEGRPRDSCTP